MGNCQAIDNASLVIQHPNGGKVERLYSTISATEVMKLNPGHYVALLLTTTTLYSSKTPSTATTATTAAVAITGTKQSNLPTQPLRITRIKLLRPTENLTVGHIYRLVTTKEVMKGLMAKKNGKSGNNMRKIMPSEDLAGKHDPATGKYNLPEKAHHQMKLEKDHRRMVAPAKSSAGGMKPKGWHPSLNSISEASS